MQYGLLSISGPPIIECYAGGLLMVIIVMVLVILWIEYQDRKDRKNDWRTEEWQRFDEGGKENKEPVRHQSVRDQCSD
ncbi:MAG: hypothetical protein ACK528_08095 [Alphaproteobacteria bacterium]|jgi:hypothetical protein